jgi:hypothetical protein
MKGNKDGTALAEGRSLARLGSLTKRDLRKGKPGRSRRDAGNK